MAEPQIAIAATPRDWAGRLHRHVTDHGGARVRATILHPTEALSEHYDVLVVDDTTSYLTAHLVGELHQRGRRILGVYDEDDPTGKGELVAAGVDDVIGLSASAEVFVAAVASLAAVRPAETLTEILSSAADGVPPEPRSDAPPRGVIIAVGAPSGGCGATEVAVCLAVHASDDAVLVDADDFAPSLAQRLGLPQYPNLSAAIDAVEHHNGDLSATLASADDGLRVLAGLFEPRNRAEVRPWEVASVIRALAAWRNPVIVDVGARLDDDQQGQQGTAQAVAAAADTVIAVAGASPVGVARLIDWVADLRAIAPHTPLHVVVNRAPTSPFKRAEIEGEIRRSTDPVTLLFAPPDARVEAAAWAGGIPEAGPFSRVIEDLVADLLPASQRRRRLARWRR